MWVRTEEDERLRQAILSRLKELRMTQTELATKLGENKENISRWLRGERAWSLENLRRVADALQTTPGSLLDGGDGASSAPRPSGFREFSLWALSAPEDTRQELQELLEWSIAVGVDNKDAAGLALLPLPDEPNIESYKHGLEFVRSTRGDGPPTHPRQASAATAGRRKRNRHGGG